MIAVIRGRRRGQRGPEVSLTPLIDMMFILLIFFMVTTSFVRETGVEVQRPQARTASVPLISKKIRSTAEPPVNVWVTLKRCQVVVAVTVVGVPVSLPESRRRSTETVPAVACSQTLPVKVFEAVT